MRNKIWSAPVILSSLLSLALAGPALASHHHGAARAAKSAALPATKDAPLSYTRLGKGPAVVLLHGIGGDRAVWAEELVRLSSKFTVVAIDLPGHGQSPAPPMTRAAPAQTGQPATTSSPIDLQAVALQVAKVIRSERLAPAVVIGHSLGGAVATWVPLVDREAVRAVLVVDSFLSAPPFTESERIRFRQDLKRDPIATLRKFFTPLTSNSAQLDKVVAAAQRVPGPVFMGYVDAIVSSELDDKVRELQVPLHLLAGPMLIANNNDAAKAKLSLQAAGYSGIPGFTYEYFPASKHWLFWDEPERYRDAVDRFLSTVTHPAISSRKSRTKL